MSSFRFDGRVALVTGAGRGIGRAYALLLAERGASVVVNDLGGSMDGTGADTGPADEVVREITSSGGSAIADATDISTAGGADKVVRTAVGAYGRIDVVINNAGIIRWAGPPEVDEANLAAHLAVHTVGSFNTVRAAWPHMAERGYGRIVNTTSSGIFGLPNNTSYATAKAAVIGLTRSLAVAGVKLGIKANLIAPAAVTRMAGGEADTPAMPPEMPAMPPDMPATTPEMPAMPPDMPAMPPEKVAPMAAFLAHEDCPVTGEIYAAGAGRFARIFIATTPGYVHDGRSVTVEDVAEHWAEINDERNYTIPASLMKWSSTFLDHLAGS